MEQNTDHENSSPPPLLSRKQAAIYLGLSEQTLAIWKCTMRYELPFVKIGRLIKYRKADLDAFILKNLEHYGKQDGKLFLLPPINQNVSKNLRQKRNVV